MHQGSSPGRLFDVVVARCMGPAVTDSRPKRYRDLGKRSASYEFSDGHSQRWCRYVDHACEPKQHVQVLGYRPAAVVDAAGDVWVLADVSEIARA